MKNIIISPKIILDKNNQINFSLEKNWIDYFYSKNINLISIYQSPIKVGKLKSLKPAGLILHGGNDIYFNKKDKINILRKKIDNELLKYALSKKIPILGVCFGFQFIADFYGVKMSYSSKHAKAKHTIDIREFIKNKKKETIRVNSFHRYVVKSLPSQFKYLSYCNDGSIEMALSKKNKIMVTMFHPERKNLDQIKIDKLILNHLKIK